MAEKRDENIGWSTVVRVGAVGAMCLSLSCACRSIDDDGMTTPVRLCVSEVALLSCLSQS